MFTGIVTDVGEVLELTQAGDLTVRIGTAYDVGGIDLGASIACEGVCLTVTAMGSDPRNWFDVQVSAETISKANLGAWTVGKRINLERALKVGDELGGHIVSGHVDGLADALRFGFDEKPRLVHRLDKDTSGVLVLARNRVAAKGLTAYLTTSGTVAARKTLTLFTACNGVVLIADLILLSFLLAD